MSIKTSTSGLQKLWESLKTDDNTNALKLLMERAYPVMFGYGMRFSKDKEFVQDCIQEVFIAIWQHRKTLVVPESPKAYLITSLRRKMINNGVRGTWIPIDSLYEFEPEQDMSLDHVVFGHEEVAFQMKLVNKLLSGLSERQREVIYLKYYQNLGRSEIANVMNISEQSVSNILQKALHSLRNSCPVGHLLLFFIWALLFA